MEQVMEIFGKDKQRLIELNNDFISTINQRLPLLEKAFEEQNSVAVEEHTHRIKSSLNLYGMVHLYHAAGRIERICRNEYPLRRAIPDLQTLRDQLPLACRVLEEENTRMSA